MAIYKGFRVLLCSSSSDPLNNVLSDLGNTVISILNRSGSGGSEGASWNLNEETPDFSPYTDEAGGNLFGFLLTQGAGTYYQKGAAKLFAVASNVQVKSVIPTSSFCIVLYNSSGYYLSTAVHTPQATGGGDFIAHDSSGANMGATCLTYAYLYSEDTGNSAANRTICAGPLIGTYSDGEITAISYKISGRTGSKSTYPRLSVGYVSEHEANTIAFLNACDQKIYPTNDPYDGLGDGTLGGSGVVGVPGMPGLTATDTGIIGLFVPSAAQMRALADFMWTDFGGTGTTTEDILKEIVEAFKRSISNPLDYILGLNIIPSQGLSVGSSSVIRFGFVSSNVSMPRLSNQYFSVDCGELFFDTVCGDTFLDYAPYSKFSIYLPYIGFKEVDANDFVGHTIGVVYHGDVVTGGLTAYITKDGSVMYQYSGSCALNIPLSSDNWGSTISAAVNIATSIVSGAVSGGVAGAGKAAALGAASVAANPSLLSPAVSHSGAVSGSAGCMGVQYPFVVREAVRFHSTNGFNTINGYSAFYFRQLSELSGFTKCYDVHLHDVPALHEELSEIEEALKEGVIL